mmetsp:Transcript_22689/g.46505  ORF Transcript_22689/g.46505 Transcript_22689/m.46505 type:complete len:305 (-) Transcript_22689:57-971(-)
MQGRLIFIIAVLSLSCAAFHLDISGLNPRRAMSVESSSSGPGEPAEGLRFLNLIGQLKSTPRTGWVYRGVGDFSRIESVADHSWRMAAAAFLFSGDPTLDVGKIVQLAVLHDVAEAIIGDITPVDGVTPEEKVRLEAEASATICDALQGFSSVGAKEVNALLHEYEARASPEAIAVKDLDMLEMIVQADEYERHGNAQIKKRKLVGDTDAAANSGVCSEPSSLIAASQDMEAGATTPTANFKTAVDLSEFFASTRGKFKTPQVQALVAELVKRREERIKAGVVDATSSDPREKKMTKLMEGAGL